MDSESKISPRRVPNRGTLPGYREDIGVPTPKPYQFADAIPFSQVQIEQIEWLWFPYIPIGKLTMLGGDPGMGKSFITDAIAAALSQGDPLPGQGSNRRGAINVLMFVGEDDPGDTLKPRLISLDANLERIYVNPRDIRLDAQGLAFIEGQVRKYDAKLFIIDPIVAYMGAKIDMNRSNEVRPMLRGLADIARATRSAGLIVRHLRKAPTNGTKGKALYAGMGSIDFTAAVRSELQVEEGRDGTKYLNHIKTNIGPKGKSITYSIIDDEFEWGDMVEGINQSSTGYSISRTPAKSEQARQLIFDMLKDHPEGVHSNDIYNAAKLAGISERTLKLAKAELVLVEKQGSHWIWKLNTSIGRVVEAQEGANTNG